MAREKVTLTVWFSEDTAPDELDDLAAAAVETLARFKQVDAVTSDNPWMGER